ncbi:penicillin-binding protein activator [Pseudomarimonas arenosa]|uniref:Penicillin-binding protein activator n=1 Tax=Pseudomarimonas arenosa TaxID=2774145 RepID=A0AAW3ZJ57_9GAMM|nr:penicillin-binding protein activator [Pseudomarimonas arenosa]MBD8525047.1 penicillin-binding protein activator [Pseudomarimonas arenosa]
MTLLRLVCPVLVLILLSACATAPASRTLSAEAEQAESLFLEGEFAAAAQAFVTAANSARGDRDAYLLRAAESYREAGSIRTADNLLNEISPRRLNADEQLRLQLLLAELALATRDDAEARNLLDPLTAANKSRHRARWLELRGRAWQRSDPFFAARLFADLGQDLQGRDRRDNAQRIRDLLASLSDQVLKSSAESLAGRDPLRAHAVRALTARGFAIPPQLRRQAAEEATPISPEASERIALLLPLSGPLRLAGEAVRDGFLAAHFQAAGQGGEIEVIDSGGDADSAINAYRRAAARGYRQVVGPLSREAVGALFASGDLPVPVLALNRADLPTPRGHMSFALTPEDEGAAAAGRLLQRGLPRVIAVVAADDGSQRALSGMQQRLTSGGGEVLGVVQIDERKVNFQEEIRAVLVAAGLPTSRPQELEIPHDPGFDAVFIAVRPAAARLLVPQLKLFGLSEVPMIGTSLLFDPAGDARMDRELSGVEFVDSPWLVDDLPGLPLRSTLSNHLEPLRGGAARLFAFGLDAWRLLNQRNAADPSMAEQGATGMLSIDEFGDVQRDPAIHVFRSGRPRRVVEGALMTDGGPQG